MFKFVLVPSSPTTKWSFPISFQMQSIFVANELVCSGDTRAKVCQTFEFSGTRTAVRKLKKKKSKFSRFLIFSKFAGFKLKTGSVSSR